MSNLSQSPEICMSEPAFWFFWQKGSSCNDGIRTPVACVTSHCLNHYTNGSSYLIECRELIINDARDVSRRRVTFWRVNHLCVKYLVVPIWYVKRRRNNISKYVRTRQYQPVSAIQLKAPKSTHFNWNFTKKDGYLVPQLAKNCWLMHQSF